MTARKRYAFFMDAEQREALAAIKQRDGIPESEQIRRGIDLWIAQKGVTKSGSKRVAPRKKP